MFGLRFSQAFESKVADVDAALIKLYTLTQRLTFAKGRVETIQGVTIDLCHSYLNLLFYCYFVILSVCL